MRFELCLAETSSTCQLKRCARFCVMSLLSNFTTTQPLSPEGLSSFKRLQDPEPLQPQRHLLVHGPAFIFIAGFAYLLGLVVFGFGAVHPAPAEFLRSPHVLASAKACETWGTQKPRNAAGPVVGRKCKLLCQGR